MQNGQILPKSKKSTSLPGNTKAGTLSWTAKANTKTKDPLPQRTPIRLPSVAQGRLRTRRKADPRPRSACRYLRPSADALSMGSSGVKWGQMGSKPGGGVGGESGHWMIGTSNTPKPLSHSEHRGTRRTSEDREIQNSTRIGHSSPQIPTRFRASGRHSLPG